MQCQEHLARTIAVGMGPQSSAARAVEVLDERRSRGERVCVFPMRGRWVVEAIRHDGTSTGEHGVGLHKLHYFEEERGAEAVEVLRKIRQAQDPLDILNPGKVVAVEQSASRE